MSSNNPLKQYFRQPSIYIRLPSNGNHYADGAIEMPINGELPVYPMTAIDEITYRTPDALFNGSAVVNVIQSCVPNIKNAWAVPAMDIDTLLTAIRIASYGHSMEFSTRCPKCGSDHEHALDLRTVLDRIKSPDYSKTIKSGDLEIFFRPMTYKNLNDNNAAQFEEQKILQLLPDSQLPETDKVTALSNAMKKITEITVKALAQSISAVKTPDSLVSETVFIEEMLEHCDRNLFNTIRDHIIETKNSAEIQPLAMTCPDCNHEYRQTVTLDMSSFFGAAS